LAGKSTLCEFAIDRTTHRVAWSYPVAGNVALSPGGILYIESYGSDRGTTTLTVINVH
jgi:hypothetical protein